jgi:hypothetical protein
MASAEERAFRVALAIATLTSACSSPFDQGAGAVGGGPVSDAGAPLDSNPGLAPGIDAAAGDTGAGADGGSLPPFSFFYTSLDAVRRLSGSPDGFGGDLRFGMPSGIEGADKICQTIAEGVGFGDKTWRAFLSITQGPDGQPVNAIDRIGRGPWYDRLGRLIAQDKAGLLAGDRPLGDPNTVNDLPDETGQGTMRLGSTYDVVTGSTTAGTLFYPYPKNTCNDWTNNSIENVLVLCGHAWLSGGIGHWVSAHPERSCKPGVNLTSNGGQGDGSSIGAAGGWGGFYCFALTP